MYIRSYASCWTVMYFGIKFHVIEEKLACAVDFCVFSFFLPLGHFLFFVFNAHSLMIFTWIIFNHLFINLFILLVFFLLLCFALLCSCFTLPLVILLDTLLFLTPKVDLNALAIDDLIIILSLLLLLWLYSFMFLLLAGGYYEFCWTCCIYFYSSHAQIYFVVTVGLFIVVVLFLLMLFDFIVAAGVSKADNVLLTWFHTNTLFFVVFTICCTLLISLWCYADTASFLTENLKLRDTSGSEIT